MSSAKSGSLAWAHDRRLVHSRAHLRHERRVAAVRTGREVPQVRDRAARR